MCVLCYDLAPEDHWSDSAPAGGPPGASRHRRTRLLASVLAPYGLTVSDPGTGPHRLVADRKGASEIAAGLPEVWRAADRMSPRPVDVLDPAVLDALSRERA
jgi:hypothetical protein